MCLLYESVHEYPRSLSFQARVATPTITVTLYPDAEKYELTHFIGHTLYSPLLTKASLMGHGLALEAEIAKQTGYAAYLRDIKIKHYAPTMTDVDFIIDAPSESPLATATIIIIIAALALIFGFIVWLFWTTYIEKEKLYYCDQCLDVPSFQGWLQYVAHLKQFHPTKYEAIEEAGEKDWWTEIPELIKYVVVGAVVIAGLGLAVELIRRFR